MFGVHSKDGETKTVYLVQLWLSVQVVSSHNEYDMKPLCVPMVLNLEDSNFKRPQIKLNYTRYRYLLRLKLCVVMYLELRMLSTILSSRGD